MMTPASEYRGTNFAKYKEMEVEKKERDATDVSSVLLGVAGNGCYQRFVELAMSQIHFMLTVLKSWGCDFYVLASVVMICVYYLYIIRGPILCPSVYLSVYLPICLSRHNSKKVKLVGTW
jgi:hypothetical protein